MRHGESVGNVDETSYSTTPDWKIELTDLGLQQASEAGKEIRQLCNGGSLYAYVSPYKRTMQTWQQIKKELEEGDGESGSSGQIVGTRQEPRIAEQQFGNFQVSSPQPKIDRSAICSVSITFLCCPTALLEYFDKITLTRISLSLCCFHLYLSNCVLVGLYVPFLEES